MDKSKLSDNEWESLLVSLKKIAGIRIDCEATVVALAAKFMH